ncbi:hypothetical protein DEO72_LG2g4235 [Vigna unguiculata]|uniref:Uncharacterized protein n=1 Tax=Vigna unguiculata TaxID=3917 RepID=A0A4D6L5T9_VIGUN|nr:hypothetical protein DEO72_LG2g4235 [Vigna unguiculata]
MSPSLSTAKPLRSHAHIDPNPESSSPHRNRQQLSQATLVSTMVVDGESLETCAPSILPLLRRVSVCFRATPRACFRRGFVRGCAAAIVKKWGFVNPTKGYCLGYSKPRHILHLLPRRVRMNRGIYSAVKALKCTSDGSVKRPNNTYRSGWVDDLNGPDRPNKPNGLDRPDDSDGPDQLDDSNGPDLPDDPNGLYWPNDPNEPDWLDDLNGSSRTSLTN